MESGRRGNLVIQAANMLSSTVSCGEDPGKVGKSPSWFSGVPWGKCTTWSSSAFGISASASQPLRRGLLNSQSHFISRSFASGNAASGPGMASDRLGTSDTDRVGKLQPPTMKSHPAPGHCLGRLAQQSCPKSPRGSENSRFYRLIRNEPKK